MEVIELQGDVVLKRLTDMEGKLEQAIEGLKLEVIR